MGEGHIFPHEFPVPQVPPQTNECLLACQRGWWCTRIPLSRVWKIDQNFLKKGIKCRCPNQQAWGERSNVPPPPPPPDVWGGISAHGSGNYSILLDVSKHLPESDFHLPWAIGQVLIMQHPGLRVRKKGDALCHLVYYYISSINSTNGSFGIRIRVKMRIRV